ncbi:MAG: hypothetical protein KDB14_08700 [Planctomycetales bacterium]|nr:hypothetical protein [Planctomycetales bacterium]
MAWLQAAAMVAPQSALARMMTFHRLRDELRGVARTPGASDLQLLDKYTALLRECRPAERSFQIIALNSIRAPYLADSVRKPDWYWGTMSSHIRQRFPDYSMYLRANPVGRAYTYSAVSTARFP